MNIRLYKKTEVNKLVEIWYEGSLIAHDFISKDYWKSKKIEMKEMYLPMSETYVISNDNDVVGFVSMVDNYLAALFIDVKHQGEGNGKRLLNFIKKTKGKIQLKVYKKNNKAVNFYLGNGFVIKEESIDDQTAEKELLMEWENGSRQ
ncbi:GNAT family acetyltransferase [Ureibacillus massiliensis 4400831 = CIP 108448 = CCUG 49529]|uniref:GNAT family acetyltransferase n=1 Tax=Ureibacillus massiliensis 4400831 = CIP 108448 = CCUG 49529 TaxID=1211035 RepID=A0A0A3JMU7_9BACL|nr:GNAT family N-acetyltransferase [Ureibacillus massiliensis]KGR88317.1 GNAT family acetyltransferase [Ureibacillus massiliensis 4400831 = CIP 108448 = CCUG 49529]